MYTFENLIDDVKKEAAALKVHATKEELAELNVQKLDPTTICDCIYGLMTGDCHSDRAIELIGSCACRYIKDPDLTDISKHGFKRIQKKSEWRKCGKF